MPEIGIAHALAEIHRLEREGERARAQAAYHAILAEHPDHTDALLGLGNLALAANDLSGAEEHFRRALTAQPNSAKAHAALAELHLSCGRSDAALAAARTALRLEPRNGRSHIVIGGVMEMRGELDAALAAYSLAVQVRPGFATAHFCLGGVLAHLGRLEEGIACLRRAVALAPRWTAAHNLLIQLIHFLDDDTAVQREVRAWNRCHADPLRAERVILSNTREPGRPLRVGYVSAYFRRHPTAYFLASLLGHHDTRQFEVFAYSDVRQPDEITAKIRATVAVWRDTVHLSDVQLAERIRNDGIDVLVDTMMHLQGSRLLVFARKPAPVQLSWIGYPGRNGLEAIDYRLGDPHLNPPGGEELGADGAAEKLVRLPDTYWCYDPPAMEPAVNDLPGRRGDRFTFGCLNAFVKVNERTLALWARVLAATNDSRLLLLAPRGTTRTRVRNVFRRGGVAEDRIDFVEAQPRHEYLLLHHQLDLALDPIPSGGQTTLCDGLWMGVPAVTLAGRTAMGRGGVSLLINAGLPEFVAQTEDEYVRIAAEWSRRREDLAILRAGLRTRLAASPLMNAPRFARAMEECYRDLWRHWCRESR